MSVLKESGLYCPNKFGLTTLRSLEEVVGKNGLSAILNLAGMSSYVGHFPTDNLDRGFDFAELSALATALEVTYGQRGGRGLALRAGRATFLGALENFGALAGMADAAFIALPLLPKLRIGLPALAKIFVHLTDQQTSLLETGSDFIWSIQTCPCCWGRRGADKPVCYLLTGLLEESLKWISSGSSFRLHESKCLAVGDVDSEFVIQKTTDS